MEAPQQPLLNAEQETLLPALYAYNLMAWDLLCQQGLKLRIRNESNIPSDDHFEELYHFNIPEQFRPRWVPSTDFPPLQAEIVARLNERAQRVKDDIAEIQGRFNRRELALLVKPAPRNYNGRELYLPFPPNLGARFNIAVSRWLNSDLVAKHSWPAHIFHHVAFPNLTAPYAMYRKFPAFHTTVASHVRNDNGNLEFIEIDRCVLSQGDQEIDVGSTNIDNFGDAATQALYPENHNDLLRPPPHELRNSPAYRSTLPNKSRCPENAQSLRQRIGNARFEQLDEFCTDQLGFPGGIREYLSIYGGAIVVMPGDWVDDPHMAVTPHHLNKQLAKARGIDEDIWTSIKVSVGNADDRFDQRAQRYSQCTDQIRAHLLSGNYAASASNESNSGLHAYGHVSVIGAMEFFFCHIDRKMNHLVNDFTVQEHSRSFYVQTLASHDQEMVGAIGVSRLGCCRNLMSWDIGCPSIGSYHVANGTATNPILGSIATVNEDFYRPTLNPRQFRFANPIAE